MNFFDTYDIARTPTPQPTGENQPSLNEEFNEVVGQLGRFWGGFKRQSQQVLEVAKKDLGDVVLQAQKEIGKLTAVDESQPEASTSAAARSAPGGPTDASATTEGSGESPASTDVAAATSSSSSPTPTERPTHSRSNSSTTASLFSRLQSAIPPNLVSTVQSHIPESIKHASENIDLAQLSSTLKTEFTRVQGITIAQAEEYARKSEALVREAMKEANEVLKDAVKIIPPSEAGEGSSGSGSGFVWDGTDMWMLPTLDGTGSASGKERAAQGAETQTAVASRALALLQRLQSDPSIVQRDPEAEEGVRDEYRKWVDEEIKAKGGIEGSEWAEKSSALLKEETTLYELYTGLVPSTLSKDDFWSRYFFRAHQIKAEEDRRKALIQASAAESDEDFSWEDDDDENATSPTAPTEKEKQPSAAQHLAARDTSAATSPRSSDSFDVVSSTTSVAGGDSSAKLADTAAKGAAAAPTATVTPKKEASDDEDDDDEDDTDDDEEEDSDSDWE